MKSQNIGTRDLTTTIEITGPDGTSLLHETFVTPANRAVDKAIHVAVAGKYNASARWSWSGEGDRSATGDLDKTVDTQKCPSVRAVVITFKVDGSTGFRSQPTETNCGA